MNQSNESDEYRERQQRTRLLVGDGGLERLRNAHVLVLGVGGVGAYAAEQLARAGIGRLTLIDGDCVEPSNCNRQLPALSSTLGQPKALVMAERLRQVNPDLDVQSRIEFIRESDVPELLAGDFDYAVDAIDSLGPKIAFLLECRRRKLPWEPAARPIRHRSGSTISPGHTAARWRGPSVPVCANTGSAAASKSYSLRKPYRNQPWSPA